MRIHEVEEKILALIQKLGDKLPAQLPTEEELSRQFGVSKNTTHSAMVNIKKQGLIESCRGRGTYAIALPGEKKKLCILVVTEQEQPYWLICISALGEILKRYGITTVVVKYSDFCSGALADLGILEHAMGAVLLGIYSRQEIERISQVSKINLVLLGESSELTRTTLPVDHVAFDNTETSYLATKYLLHKGHRRIALSVGCNSDDVVKHRTMIYTQELVTGYKNALRECGSASRPEWIFNIDEMDRRFAPSAGDMTSLPGFDSPESRPTALLHFHYNEYDFRYKLDMLLPGVSSSMEIMPMLPKEELLMYHVGYKAASAMCNNIYDRAEAVVECLLHKRKPGSPSRRIVLHHSELWLRERGRWGAAAFPWDNQEKREEQTGEGERRRQEVFAGAVG